jgi:hypothetical protein
MPGTLFFSKDILFCQRVIFPGANPTIVGYVQSSCKNLNDTSSLVRFVRKIVSFNLNYNAGVGFAPGLILFSEINNGVHCYDTSPFDDGMTHICTYTHTFR